MKHTPLITTLLMLAAVMGLHAQTSTVLVKSGDLINGTASKSAKLLSFGNVSMNDAGGIAFQGYANETNAGTPIIRTNLSVSYQYTNVLTILSTNRFNGTVTNVLSITNLWNVNGTTNAYISTYPQIRYATNIVGTTNSNSLSTFISTFYQPQGGHNVTNFSVITTNIVTSISYSGVWASDTNGNLNLMIRSGQPAGISNAVITSFTDPVINNNGAAAFVGYSMVSNSALATNGLLSNSVSSAGTIYLQLQGSTNLIPVASVGSTAPGTIAKFTSFNNLALPDVGGVIFVGMAGTNQGVWVQNSDTSVCLVALRGQTMTVGTNNKVVSSFNLMNAPYPGVTRSYSSKTGSIIYQAYFTDGSSAIIQVNR